MCDFMEIGWNATSTALRFARVIQQRETDSDRTAFKTLARLLSQAGTGDWYNIQSDMKLFSTCEGLYVLAEEVHERRWACLGETTRNRLASLAGIVNAVGIGTNAEFLRGFFRAVHDAAEEIVALGLHVDPVVGVFRLMNDQDSTINVRDAITEKDARITDLRAQLHVAYAIIGDGYRKAGEKAAKRIAELEDAMSIVYKSIDLLPKGARAAVMGAYVMKPLTVTDEDVEWARGALEGGD